MQALAIADPGENAATNRGRGRPPVITLPIVREIGTLIAKGMTEEQACIRVGIKHASFRTAKHRNSEFETVIKEAQADFWTNP